MLNSTPSNMPKEFHSNRGYKGINTDMSFLERTQEQLLDARNVRITRKDTEGGLFMATIEGNTLEFSPSSGMVPLGAKEFGGILFTINHNQSTGLSEIGTFPSPKAGGGFERVYRPLQNFTLDNPAALLTDSCNPLDLDITTQQFQTDNLGLSCESQLRMELRIDYDGSLNIYWTDNLNPIRVVNCGFNITTGFPTGRYISKGMIDSGGINLLNESSSIPIVELRSLDNDGSLLAGHYFFYIRYTDPQFNATSFLGQSFPVPIFNINNDSAYGGEEQAETNMSVNLRISNLDINFPYIEVGYAYYYGEDESLTSLIDKRYAIEGNGTIDIKITGGENDIPIDITELVLSKPSNAIYAKDIAQLNNVLYMANTRGPELDHPDLRDFACLLSLAEDDTYRKDVPPIDVTDPAAIQIDDIYGKDPLEVNTKAGYFSGETYCYGLVPVLKGGFYGQPIPMQGFDNYEGVPISPNNRGVYRFSRAQVKPFFDGTQAIVKGIKVVVSPSARSIYDNSQWLKDNLLGVVIVRSERNETLLYQGLAARVYRGTHLHPDYNTLTITPIIEKTEDNKNERRKVPVFEPAIYNIQFSLVELPLVPDRRDSSVNYFSSSGGANAEKNELCVFSADYYVNNRIVPDNVFVHMIGTTRYEDDWRRDQSPAFAQNTFFGLPSLERENSGLDGVSPIIPVPPFPFGIADGVGGVSPIAQQKTFTGYSQLGITYSRDKFETESLNIQAFDAIGDEEFISKVTEGKSAGEDGLYYSHNTRSQVVLGIADDFRLNAPLALPSYIALKNAPDFVGNGIDDSDPWYRAIVNVYKSDPDTIDYRSLYDFKNETFAPISQFILIEDFLPPDDISTRDHLFYGGDCFTSRTYLKLMHGHTDGLGEEFIDNVAEYGGRVDDVFTRGYGHWMSVVTENKCNPNYRYEKGRNHYMPGNNVLNYGSKFAWQMDAPESNFYNKGYKRMLSDKKIVFLGTDVNRPIANEQFPTRIRASLTHVFNAIQDSYRVFALADFQDYDYQHGQINVLMRWKDLLYSMQEDAINLHPIDERVIQQGDQGSAFTLGGQQKLPSYKNTITVDFGTQHQWSVVRGERGIYGFDWNKRLFWRVSGEQAQDLGLSKGCEGFIDSVVNLRNSGRSDVVEQLPDNPVCREGIHGGFDAVFKEVLMTFIFDGSKHTLCFSEKIDNFMTRYTFTPIMYVKLEKDLYSFSAGSWWLHGNNPIHNNFYGNQDEWEVTVVVNPQGEVTKHWDNVIISSNNRTPQLIEYTTQHQQALQDPFVNVNEFWYLPVYRENQWKFPIRRADSTRNEENNISSLRSHLRGRYLIIRLRYLGGNPWWVREIITAFLKSKA